LPKITILYRVMGSKSTKYSVTWYKEEYSRLIHSDLNFNNI
jgi:hypothetical protein